MITGCNLQSLGPCLLATPLLLPCKLIRCSASLGLYFIVRLFFIWKWMLPDLCWSVCTQCVEYKKIILNFQILYPWSYIFQTKFQEVLYKKKSFCFLGNNCLKESYPLTKWMLDQPMRFNLCQQFLKNGIRRSQINESVFKLNSTKTKKNKVNENNKTCFTVLCFW